MLRHRAFSFVSFTICLQLIKIKLFTINLPKAEMEIEKIKAERQSLLKDIKEELNGG